MNGFSSGRWRSDAVLLMLSLLTALTLGLYWVGVRRGPTIVIGSKTFPESHLLGEIMATIIEQNCSIQVERRLGLGGTSICFTALQHQEIDVYAEYTGTGLLIILKEPLGENRDPQTVFNRVKDGFLERYQLRWLQPFGFNNSYALAVRQDSELKRISDLAVDEATVRAGFGHEFLGREDGYPALANYYGFRLKDVRGLDHGLAYRAIRIGDIDVMDAYATDGRLLSDQLRLLEDDRRFFPPYSAAPLIRKALVDRHPKVTDQLNRLAGMITQERMVQLNYQVEVEKRSFAAVAQEFLHQAGLISDAGQHSSADEALMSIGKLIPLIVQHLKITLSATGLATVVGVALGLLVARYPKRLAVPVLGATGVLQTIPSLALLAIMVPLLGTGEVPAIVALFVYALMPIVRNTYVGISSVPAELKEAGRGQGMTDRQLMWHLELPLATKTIMAGVRTSLVINIGTATVATLIGAGGLGGPIKTGIDLNDDTLILWGAIPAALLALSCDWLMARLETLIEPKGLQIGR